MFAPYAKAYAALIGSMCTALLGVYAADTEVGKVLTVASILATTFATFQVKNAPEDVQPDEAGATDTGILLLVAIFVGVLLLLFGVRFDR